MIFAVIQEPKFRYRQAYVSVLHFVEAKSKTEALRLAQLKGDAVFMAPYAQPVIVGETIRI